MHKKFNHKEIEKKWQSRWKENGIYNVKERDPHKEKKYVLVELPYPSGNLHIGHWFAFAVVDIYVRALKMQGKQVMFPIGFDAFGLPAENAAIKHGKDPKKWTESNIAHMTEQLESMGNAFTWNKTTQTCDPEYYKWTQLMFTLFFEKGLAYRGTGMVNWCPGCNTVIANEQVKPDNTCERSGDTIIQKEMPQWMFRITTYADRLIDNLDTLSWPEHIKESQRQWIGRSRGAKLTFALSTGDTLHVFTTRPDTLFGATYMVLAPEHELVLKNKDVIKNWHEVSTYITESSKKDTITRTNANREKTGVPLEGISATNPANGETIPVFIADYVLKEYGTGAIMAVPAHDERDFEFAKKFNLPIVRVIESSDELPSITRGVLLNSAEFDGMDSEEAKKKITENVGGEMTNTYRLRDWSIGRQRYWGVPIPIVYDPQGKAHTVPKEHLPWLLPTDVDFTPTGEPPLAKSIELRSRVERIFGSGWTPEVETMDTFVDSSWYFLRYIDNKNVDSFASIEEQKKWMPVDLYFGGAEHNTMHLLYSRFWQMALYDLGLTTTQEPYVTRINRGLVLGPDGNKMSKSKGNVIDPDEQVKSFGADTVKMYLAFMGPYGECTNYPWDLGGIVGLRRFLERVNGLFDNVSTVETHETTQLLHRTIAKVTHDIITYKFNTAISALMIFVNHAEKSGLTMDSYKTFLRLLAPFAPHLTEEIWEQHANDSSSIHEATWPISDSSFLVDESVTIALQINGKTKGSFQISTDASEDAVRKLISETPSLQRHMPKHVSRVIFVKNKIINIVSG